MNTFKGHSCSFRQTSQQDNRTKTRITCKCGKSAAISKQSCDSKLCIKCWPAFCKRKGYSYEISECLSKHLLSVDVDPLKLRIKNTDNPILFQKEQRHLSDNLLTEFKRLATNERVKVEIIFKLEDCRLNSQLSDDEQSDEEDEGSYDDEDESESEEEQSEEDDEEENTYETDDDA